MQKILNLTKIIISDKIYLQIRGWGHKQYEGYRVQENTCVEEFIEAAKALNEKIATHIKDGGDEFLQQYFSDMQNEIQRLEASIKQK